MAAIWEKLIVNVTINPICGITGLRMGELARLPATDRYQDRLIEEALAVARAKGLALPEADLRARIKTHCWDKYSKPSMLQHLEAGRRTEIAALNGALVREAQALGVAVPFNEAIALLIEGRQLHEQQRSQRAQHRLCRARGGSHPGAATVIDEPPRLTIRRRPAAPSAELLRPFLEAPTGWLIDAMSGRGAMDTAIKPLAPEIPAMRRFVGPALTCWCGPNDNLALLAAVSLAEPGDVIVAACEGFTGSGMAGDLVVGMTRNRGAAALVTDGMVRDRDGIVAVGLPVFCRGVTPNSCVRSGPGTVGLPVTAGGVPVATGDLLLGDADGVVVVPRVAVGRGRRAARHRARGRAGGRGQRARRRHDHAGNRRAAGLGQGPLDRLGSSTGQLG